MTNEYKFQVRAKCPIHAELIDLYDVTIRTGAIIKVEDILEWFNQFETAQIFQEEIARQAAVKFGCSVEVRGIHSGVSVISYAP